MKVVRPTEPEDAALLCNVVSSSSSCHDSLPDARSRDVERWGRGAVVQRTFVASRFFFLFHKRQPEISSASIAVNRR